MNTNNGKQVIDISYKEVGIFEIRQNSHVDQNGKGQPPLLHFTLRQQVHFFYDIEKKEYLLDELEEVIQRGGFHSTLEALFRAGMIYESNCTWFHDFPVWNQEPGQYSSISMVCYSPCQEPAIQAYQSVIQLGQNYDAWNDPLVLLAARHLSQLDPSRMPPLYEDISYYTPTFSP